MDDEKILNMFFERDEKVIEEVKKQYGKTCYSIAYGVLRSNEDAEEIVSDALLSVWYSIPPEKPSSFSAYLYKTVRYKAISRLRSELRSVRSRHNVPFEEIEPFLPGSFCVDDAVDSATLAQIINSFLENLDALPRRIFICRYFSEMKIKQISKKFGISQSKTKTLLKSCRSALCERLKKEGYDYE